MVFPPLLPSAGIFRVYLRDKAGGGDERVREVSDHNNTRIVY